jgi:hypothetical protein
MNQGAGEWWMRAQQSTIYSSSEQENKNKKSIHKSTQALARALQLAFCSCTACLQQQSFCWFTPTKSAPPSHAIRSDYSKQPSANAELQHIPYFITSHTLVAYT